MVKMMAKDVETIKRHAKYMLHMVRANNIDEKDFRKVFSEINKDSYDEVDDLRETIEYFIEHYKELQMDEALE